MKIKRTRAYRSACTVLRRIHHGRGKPPDGDAIARIRREAAQDEDFALLLDTLLVLGVLKIVNGDRMPDDAERIATALLWSLVDIPLSRRDEQLAELRAAWDDAPDDMLERAVAARARIEAR